MKSVVFYRIAAVLLVLFTVGHTLGFSQSDPTWGVDAVLASMRSIHFDMMGSPRTLWDFFLASGYTVAVFYVFSAILAWQLGGLPGGSLRGARWAFALCFAGVAVVSWKYLFVIPIAFSAAIAVCLLVAALLSGREARSGA